MRALLVLLSLCLALPALAAESGMGSFGAWRAFRVIEQGQHVCYMIAHPVASSTPKVDAPPAKAVKGKKGKKEKKAAAPAKREAYIVLTFRPAESMAPVFTYNAGMMLKESAEATLVSAKDNFSLFTAQDSAWARTSSIDQGVAKILRRGGMLEITVPAARGGMLKDTFDLKGGEAAYKKIATACGIPQ